MTFIGIISDNKSEKIITNILNDKLGKDTSVISINSKSIENFKNIKFETILITNNNSILEDHKDSLKRILQNTRYLILNADISIYVELEQEEKLNVITFGFNPKATITASSVEDEILLCVQRTIKDINEKEIEQQEMKISFFENIGINTSNLIGIATILILYEKINKIDKK